MKYSTSPVRGTVDYLPAETEVRDYAQQTILNSYLQNGFLHIKTPILENLELLTSGDSGDNQKLMFKTIKRGADLDLTKPDLKESDIVEEGLRYDLTVPLVRFFIEYREKLPFPFKSIQIDEAFRAERPQKGRVRQFTQCDIDILGESSPLAEIELLLSGADAYKKLGFDGLTIKLNDRRILNELVVLAGFESEQTIRICISLDKFDKIGKDAVKDELINSGYDENKVLALMSMFEKLQNCDENSGKIYEILKEIGVSEEVVSSVRQIIESVRANLPEGIDIVYDASVIRGQGYYTGTIFEVFDKKFGRALGGGGRYDGMVEKFAGTKVPAVGFSIGFYSTVMLMLERGFVAENKKLALVYSKGDGISEILSAKQKLIGEGFCVSTFAFPKNFNEMVRRLKLCGYTKIVKMNDLSKKIDI